MDLEQFLTDRHPCADQATSMAKVKKVAVLMASGLGVSQKYLLVGSTAKAKRMRKVLVILCHHLHPELKQRCMAEALLCSTSYICRALSEEAGLKLDADKPFDRQLMAVFDAIYFDYHQDEAGLVSPLSGNRASQEEFKLA